MKKKVYLAFINDHFPPQWRKIPEDVNKCLPYPIDHIMIKMDLNLFFSEERNQYHSTLILAQVLGYLPDDGAKILGIINVDIYIPILTFLFGEAQFKGKGALVSTFRLRNKYYGLPEDNDLLYTRTLKEILHELGHTLGLVHCPNFECVMNSSTYVENIDLKLAKFCQLCQDQLKISCKE